MGRGGDFHRLAARWEKGAPGSGLSEAGSPEYRAISCVRIATKRDLGRQCEPVDTGSRQKWELRRPGELFFRICDQFPEHLDSWNTGRLKRIFCGIPPNRRSFQWSPVWIVFGAAAVHHKRVL